MNSYHYGRLAELIARIYMRLHGYHIVCQNYSSKRGTHVGEIDFIARRGKTLVFVEVKKRRSAQILPYAINKHQQQRIIMGAKHFLQRHKQYSGFDIRFDAILICLPFHLEHIKNAWQADS